MAHNSWIIGQYCGTVFGDGQGVLISDAHKMLFTDDMVSGAANIVATVTNPSTGVPIVVTISGGLSETTNFPVLDGALHWTGGWTHGWKTMGSRGYFDFGAIPFGQQNIEDFAAFEFDTAEGVFWQDLVNTAQT